MKRLTTSKLSRPVFKIGIQADQAQGHCWACGAESAFDFSQFINDDLTRQWKISDTTRHAFSSRESRQCKHCGANHRNRHYAEVLCRAYATTPNVNCLKDLVQDPGFQKLAIAEINACGYLHQFLGGLPNLSYSEFDSDDHNIRSEDIQKLTYADDTFDLVLTSDTLEHIPDYKQALREINRVLKPGGKHIFTIPVIWQRSTQRRAEFTTKGDIEYLLEAAYHGLPDVANLVWTDFGGDILQTIDALGFQTKVVRYNVVNPHDASCVLMSTKVKAR